MLHADESALRRTAEAMRIPLTDAILRGLRQATPLGQPVPTVLAVCPNSEAVVKAAVLAAKEADAPLFFAATLNQVDLDGGYTGWTPEQFVRLTRELVSQMRYAGPVVVGLDHGGPWLKDIQAREGWPSPGGPGSHRHEGHPGARGLAARPCHAGREGLPRRLPRRRIRPAAR